MHGCIRFRLARMLALLSVCGISAAAQGQQPQTPAMQPSYGYGLAGEASVQRPFIQTATPDVGARAFPVSTSMEAAPPDTVKMAAEVADLKKQLKAIQDKDAAAKKKSESQPSIAIGGMVQLDTAAFSNKDLPAGMSAVDGVEFRRVRLQASGEMFLNMDYKLEMEFATSDRPRMKDMYLTVRELPYLQNVRIGHFKEPFGLEQLTSDRFGTFMERSMADDGFIVPSRNIGVMSFGWTENERATYALGGFLNEPGIENPPSWPPIGTAVPAGFTYDDRSQCALTARGTWLPWYDEATEGRGLWHTGLGYSYRADEGIHNALGYGALFRGYEVRPEAHLAPVILGTGSGFLATHNQLLGIEQALVYGPLSVQSEFFADRIARPDTLQDVTFTGFYAYVSYFLTGENRPYNRKGGYFDRVRPYTNFFRVRTDDGVETGWGAWEVGYRFTYVDMYGDIPTAQTVTGLGQASDHTLGLNWYFNPYSRMMFNYVFTNFDRVNANGAALSKDYHLNTFEVRAQFDF